MRNKIMSNKIMLLSIIGSIALPTPSGAVMTSPTVVPQALSLLADSRKAGLKQDLSRLFKTLNELDRITEAKQADIAKKMQNANTPAEQAEFFKEVVAQLDTQKATLNSLKFHDPRVGNARDKMVESIDYTREGVQTLITIPDATPETHPEIVKRMENAQKAAKEARDRLVKLTEEADINK